MRNMNRIRGKMLVYIWACIVPFLLLFGFSVVSMYRTYVSYDLIVTNITRANEYNRSFKIEMDEEMYRIIIGSANWTNPLEKLEGDDPKSKIREARQHFVELLDNTEGKQVRADLTALIKLLDILDRRVDDILANVEEGGHYDENMEMLDLNIRTLTSLIQEDIHTYIYDEVTNMESLRRQTRDGFLMTMRVLIAMMFVLLVSVYMIAGRLADGITRPVTRLCEMTQKFAGGDFSVSYHPNTHDEMETLAESFNSMVGEIGTLVRGIHLEQQNAREAELRLLQEQVNPHFLYNTLDAIIWLTESGENDQAVRMTQELSNFFRTTLSKGKDLITVREEESHIRSYLEIQHFRYQDILDYSISFSEDIQDCCIQKLTLQPIVENAIYHGIKNKRGKGMITVEGRAKADSIEIQVHDNGIGMKPEELEHLNALIAGEEEPKQGHGFGMANVQQRIHMQFGPEYGITAESVYQEGTIITITIPRTELATEAEHDDRQET